MLRRERRGRSQVDSPMGRSCARAGLRGVTSTEWLLLVVLVAAAGIAAYAFLGRRTSDLVGDATRDLDGRRVSSPLQPHTSDLGSRPTPPVNHGAPPANLPLAEEPDHAQSILGDVSSYGSPESPEEINWTHLYSNQNLSEEQRRRLLEAFSKLPLGLRGFRIDWVTRTDDPNAYYLWDQKRLKVGDWALYPDQAKGANQEAESKFLVNPGFTPERLIFHELIHGWHDEHDREVADFLKLGYQERSAAFRKDRRWSELRCRRAELKKMLEHFGSVLTGGGSLSHREALDRVDRSAQESANVRQTLASWIKKYPNLRADWQDVNSKITALFKEHGLPSRFSGDVHAIDNQGREYFAMVIENARYQSNDHEAWKQRASAAEVRWTEEHAALWKD